MEIQFFPLQELHDLFYDMAVLVEEQVREILAGLGGKNRGEEEEEEERRKRRREGWSFSSLRVSWSTSLSVTWRLPLCMCTRERTRQEKLQSTRLEQEECVRPSVCLPVCLFICLSIHLSA